MAVAAGRQNGIDADLEACARGDKFALRRIYEVESPRMLGVAMRLLKRRPLAEDALQDAFILIWRHAATFDPTRGTGRSWIYTILRNRSLSILRDEARLEPSGTAVATELASDEDDPERVVSRLSDASALKRCLETLPPQKRGMVLLAFAHGLTHGEIAERLRMPLGTVKTWIRRSLIGLRECLG